MSVKKNAEYFGYKEGDKFKYNAVAVKYGNFKISGRFGVNDTLTLIKDDGTRCPRFENQDGVKAHECWDLLEKLETKPKPSIYAEFVGKTLTVMKDGYGFADNQVGTPWQIEACSSNGYMGAQGFKVVGYDNGGYGFVGVESFFPDGLNDEVIEEQDIEHRENDQGEPEQATTCPTALVQEMLMESFDDHVSVDISINGAKVTWQDLTFVVDKKASLEQILKAINVLSQQLNVVK